MGDQSYQYHSPQHYQNSPDYDPNQYHHSNQFNHHPSYQNQPNQSRNPYCEDHLPKWSSGNRQGQNSQSYQSQFNPSQGQHHPHHQQDFDHSLNLNQHARSIEEKIEELITSPQSMRSSLKSNDKMALGVQNAHDEHKASMNKMIRQASQLADVIRKMQGNRGRLLSNEHKLDKADVSETTGGTETLGDEPVSELPLEEHREVRDVERVLAKEDSQHEVALIATPQRDEASREDSEEATDEPQRGAKEEEAMRHLGKAEATLFCLETRMVHSLGKNVEELTSGKAGEDLKQEIIESETPAAQTEIPYPMIDSEKEGPNQKGKRAGKGTARRICLKKLERWPILIGSKDPSNHSLRPKEKRKIQGTYKNHRKKRETTLVMHQQGDSWKKGTAEEEGILNVFPGGYFYGGMALLQLIKLKGNSDLLDPADHTEDTGARQVEACEEGRKLPTNEHKNARATNWAESTTPPVQKETDVSQLQTSRDQPTCQLTRHPDEVAELQGSTLDYNFSLLNHLKEITRNNSTVCTVGDIPLRTPNLLK